jgi:hypothetical protein
VNSLLTKPGVCFPMIVAYKLVRETIQGGTKFHLYNNIKCLYTHQSEV